MDEWLELESDPGLFSLLLEDFGVKGVQVEEVYDIQTNFEGPVYGFIFLFKWIEERRSRRKVILDEENYVIDDDIVNSMFFAKQIINNSCATHALLSVLLNYDNLSLGPVLTRLKQFTRNMNPDDKGYTIGNMPDLARAHNSHSRPEPYRLPGKQREGISVRTGDAFHFVSYVPVNGHLYELDGLKPYPIDHGPWGEGEDWIEHFRRIIAARLGVDNGGGEPYHDIRFNLLAVVPDKRSIFTQKLATLKMNRTIIQDTLQQILDTEMMKGPGNAEVKSESETTDALNTPVKIKTEPEEKPTMSDVVQKLENNINSSPSPGARTPTLPSVRSSARLRKKSSAYSSAFTNTSSLGDNTGCINGEMKPEEVYSKVTVKIDNEETDSDVDIMDDDEPRDKSVPMATTSNTTVEPNTTETSTSKPVQNSTDSALGTSFSPWKTNSMTGRHLQTVETSEVKFHISVTNDHGGGAMMPTTLASTDVTKPLSIQTKFGYLPVGPGTGSSTDTASEVGSGLSSPVCSTGQPSPNVFKASPNSSVSPGQRLLGQRRDSPQSALLKSCPSARAAATGAALERRVPGGESRSSLTSGSEAGSPEQHHRSRRKRYARQHGFTPKDLVQLLKNVESEIEKCEQNLKDEIEKMQKYRDDDARRTHNYDAFIITFLSMLAQQGKLTELVQEPHRKRAPPGRRHSNSKKVKQSKKR